MIQLSFAIKMPLLFTEDHLHSLGPHSDQLGAEILKLQYGRQGKVAGGSSQIPLQLHNKK